MAFGKDPKQLDNIGTFRQMSKAHQAMRPKGGGGGAKPTWLDAFKPSTDDPDVVRVLKGTYQVEMGQPDGSLVKQTLFYFPYTEHFHGTLKKGSICSAGPLANLKDKRQPCVGCDLFWEGRANGKKNGPMSKREMYAFTVLHYAPYAKVEQRDRSTGAVRTNSEGVAYTEWKRIFAHEKAKYAKLEVQEAHLLHWSIGYGHWTTLTEYDRAVGQSCKSCGGRDTIKMEAWTCRGCGAPLIEAETTQFSPKEIDEYTTGEVRCAECKHEGFLEEYVSCSSCSEGKRADIFDVDLSVKRIADPNGGNATTLGIMGWSNPKPIDARFVEMAKPMDLAKTFAPTPLEKQAELFGRSGGGRQPVTSGQHTRSYQPGGKAELGIAPPAKTDDEGNAPY